MKETKPQWKVDYKESGQREKDARKAATYGHTAGAFAQSLRYCQLKEEWEKTLRTYYFVQKVEEVYREKLWIQEYEASGKKEIDIKRAQQNGHNLRAIITSLRSSESLQEWQSKLDTKYFLHKKPPAPPKVRPEWKVSREKSGQHLKDIEGALKLNHPRQVIAQAYGRAKSQEEWEEALKTRFAEPYKKVESKKEHWREQYESSGGYEKDLTKAIENGHILRSFTGTYGKAKSQKAWTEKLSTIFHKPKKQNKEEAKQAWQLNYELNGSYQQDFEKAKENNHLKTSFTRMYKRSNSLKEWKVLLTDFFFLPKQKKQSKSTKPTWKSDLERSGEYAKVKQKALNNGHTAHAFAHTFIRSQTLEEWTKKLNELYFRPKEKDTDTRLSWKKRREDSGQHKKDFEKSKALGHNHWQFGSNYGHAKKEKQWLEILEKVLFKPCPTTFLKSWDGRMASMFGFIEELGFKAPSRPRLISQLIDSIIDWLQELGVHTKPLILAIRSDDFMDQVTRKEQMRDSAA